MTFECPDCGHKTVIKPTVCHICKKDLDFKKLFGENAEMVLGERRSEPRGFIVELRKRMSNFLRFIN